MPSHDIAGPHCSEASLMIELKTMRLLEDDAAKVHGAAEDGATDAVATDAAATDAVAIKDCSSTNTGS